MDPTTFLAIKADIEAQLDPGEGYWLALSLRSGAVVTGAVLKLVGGAVVLQRGDKPDAWVALSAIESIEIEG